MNWEVNFEVRTFTSKDRTRHSARLQSNDSPRASIYTPRIAVVNVGLQNVESLTMFRMIAASLVLFLSFDVCGYKPAGKGKSLPANIKTIAVTVFKNPSLRYRVEQRFTQAVIDEILRRARGMRVVTSTEDADAVMEGEIRSFRVVGTILDDAGRTRMWDLRIIVGMTIRDARTHKILFSNPRMLFSNEYQLSDDPKSFFNEENPAVDRIARDFAQSILSTILEGL
jgi:hypothetical protein